MKVDTATVHRIARLARIRVSPEEAQALEGELTNILGWVEQLDEVDTDGVAPMTSVVEIETPERDDVVNDGGIPDRIVANAPVRDGHYFAVPKVVE
ncbi:MAG: Asp-tRNA(Asn)/Glu-tRNA(Gln) amidotransferase subunit GatC [Pseudomonadota bacterium]